MSHEMDGCWYCSECDRTIPVREEGDVVRCSCGQWHHMTDVIGFGLRPWGISASRAALLAREPMDHDACIAALDGAAERMEAPYGY